MSNDKLFLLVLVHKTKTKENIKNEHELSFSKRLYDPLPPQLRVLSVSGYLYATRISFELTQHE